MKSQLSSDHFSCFQLPLALANGFNSLTKRTLVL